MPSLERLAMKPKIYSYWRSSAAFRVRIALNLKGIDHEIIPIHLVNNGGEQMEDTYVKKNPNRLVPLWEDGQNSIHQSLAIIEYLEEIQAEPPSYQRLPLIARGYAQLLWISPLIFTRLAICEYCVI